jgi:hypothetical protein
VRVLATMRSLHCSLVRIAAIHVRAMH